MTQLNKTLNPKNNQPQNWMFWLIWSDVSFSQEEGMWLTFLTLGLTHSDIFFVAGNFAHEKVEKRTLSCQTDMELLQLWMKLHSHLLLEPRQTGELWTALKSKNDSQTDATKVSTSESGQSYELPEWATLSATALLQNMTLQNRRFERHSKKNYLGRRRNQTKPPQIVEESVTDDSENEHSGKFKQITISLGDVEPDRLSNASQPGTNSTNSPVSWSSKSDRSDSVMWGQSVGCSPSGSSSETWWSARSKLSDSESRRSVYVWPGHQMVYGERGVLEKCKLRRKTDRKLDFSKRMALVLIEKSRAYLRINIFF